MIESFEIQNYRLFKNLKIEKLGRVNLITGKNNVGKTALLEALYLYQTKGSVISMGSIFRNRDLWFSKMHLSIVSIFHGFNPKTAISLGDHQKLTLKIGPYIEERNGTDIKKYLAEAKDDFPIKGIPGLEIKHPDYHNILPLDRDVQQLLTSELIATYGNPQPIVNFRSSQSGFYSFYMWDNMVLTPLEKEIKEYLKIFSPQIEDITTSAHPHNEQARTFIVKIAGIDKPVDISTMGEGTTRLLGLILSLVSSKDGVLLIDQIENGIHYSIQTKLWDLVFYIAEQMNIQVFATTHSWDCIEGFQRALNNFHDKSQGQLLRLSMRNDDIIATSLDARELAIATRENIEVR